MFTPHRLEVIMGRAEVDALDQKVSTSPTLVFLIQASVRMMRKFVSCCCVISETKRGERGPQPTTNRKRLKSAGARSLLFLFRRVSLSSLFFFVLSVCFS